MTAAPMTGQLDLLALLEPEPAPAPVRPDRVPCLFNSPARGLAARLAEFEAWVAAYDNFACFSRSHAWTVHAACGPKDPTDRCQPALISADLWPWEGTSDPGPDCSGHDRTRAYRGACCGCSWEGPDQAHEHQGVEDACDHAWPGWRDLPVLRPVPYHGKPDKKWKATALAAYPAGWLEAGGPVKTLADNPSSRHVPGRSPWGGYDMAANLLDGAR